MASRGGRDRFRRDYPSRSEDKGHHGRSNPPSRHLWVGNLSHNLTESTLARQFLQFGELESLSFQPGRSYAFINYRNEDDAFAAIRELQGFVVAGNPLRIEFTKAEKSLLPPRSEDYVQHRDHQRPSRRSPFSQRDSGVRHFSPDPPYLDKSKSGDKSTEPSEVLWIGFPAQLKVDEFILKKAFSPFGVIDKITAFPGRTYAFVRFRNVMSACKAKDTLQGKLFGNPRVHICFAKNESGTSNRERNAINASPSSHFRSSGHMGSIENFHQDRHYADIAGDISIRSPHFVSDLEPSDPDVIGFGRKGKLWAGGNGAFKRRRFPEADSGLGPPENVYEQSSPLKDRGAPIRDRGVRFRDYSPPQHPPEGGFYDDPWDLPEDVSLFHEAKKLKTGSFPPENELPEYPFSASEISQQIPSKYNEFPQLEVYDKNLEAGPLGYKPMSDRIMNITHPHGGRNDHLNVSYDGLQVSSVPLPSKPDWKRFTPEPQQPTLNKEWKWEGTIAKGGTPVCRARCFPVGKVMEMMLPEFLDCTARTSLDMLAKHYYQAASAWVVFFVPASDPDIAYYNEFMNYLGEKQRAAVAKLDDRTTLFLVSPSEFSENVLKVPGRLSISGVILRLEQSGPSYGSLHHQPEKNDTDLTSFHGNTTHPKPTSPSVPYSSVPSIPNFEKSETFPENFSKGVSRASYSGSSHSIGNLSGDRHEYLLPQRNPEVGPNWSAHEIQNASNRSVVSQASNRTVDSIGQRHAMPRSVQDNSMNYTTEIPAKLSVQENPPPSSMPVSVLQTEQLAQLASTLFGQRQQSGAVSTGEDFRQPGTTYQSENSYRTSQNYAPPNSNISPELSSSQFGQVHQLQQHQHIHNVPGALQKGPHPGSQMNQQSLNAGQEEDPQTRLHATLQLAAALLQQIQGKGT